MSPGERELSGRVAIVTGAGVGIGAGIAVALAEAGAAVAVADVDVGTAASTARGIEAKGGRGLAVRVDVSDADQVRNMVERTAEAFGSVDILVNNAGIATTQLVEDLDEIAWRRVLEVNLTGAFLCSKAVLPLMREKGWGRIVNIASVAAKRISFTAPRATRPRRPGSSDSPVTSPTRSPRSASTSMPSAPVRRSRPCTSGTPTRKPGASASRWSPKGDSSPPTTTAGSPYSSAPRPPIPCAASPSTSTAGACSAGCHGRSTWPSAGGNNALER